jgi:lipopolysaccharide/colanic/teichoic acid biosynthesis glycosyltransferase
VTPPRPARYDRAKRITDILGAALGLFVLAPILAVTALVVLVGLGRPILLRQVRAGRDGRPFRLVKFRTMRPVDVPAGLVTDADRLTGVGRALRATSLDELPTLWNVLRGEMSLVGPRPLLMEYLPRYTCEQARRHEVRPGVTGLAQVRGRNELSWEVKLALDVWYVDHRGPWLDARLMLDTVRVALRRDGICAAGHATAPEFLGSAAMNSRSTGT